MMILTAKCTALLLSTLAYGYFILVLMITAVCYFHESLVRTSSSSWIDYTAPEQSNDSFNYNNNCIAAMANYYNKINNLMYSLLLLLYNESDKRLAHWEEHSFIHVLVLE